MNMGVRIVDVLASAFRSIESNWATWLKLILAPLLLAVLCQVGAGLADETNFETPLQIVAGLLSFLFGTMMAVNIYRYGILNEHTSSWLSLRIDRPVWMMIVYAILIYLLLLIAGGIVGGIYLLSEDVGITAGVGGVIGIIGLYIALRLSLLLPAVAIGLEQPLRRSFHITGGNVIFIFMTLFTMTTTFICVFLVTAVPFGIAAAVLSLSFLVDETIGLGIMAALGFLYFAVCYLYIIALSGKTLSNIYLDCKKNS